MVSAGWMRGAMRVGEGRELGSSVGMKDVVGGGGVGIVERAAVLCEGAEEAVRVSASDAPQTARKLERRY